MSEATNRFIAVAVDHSIEPPKKADGHPQVFVRLRVVEGPEAGRELSWYGSLHPNAMEITAKALRAMGWQDNDIVKLTGLGSTKVTVTETEEEYQGKTKKRYNVFAARATFGDDELDDIASRYRSLAIAVKPITVNDSNAAPDVLPAPRGRNGETEAATGLPF